MTRNSEVLRHKLADIVLGCGIGLRSAVLWNENKPDVVDMAELMPSCAFFVGRSSFHLQKIRKCLPLISQILVGFINAFIESN
jgi:hypothetical protein